MMTPLLQSLPIFGGSSSTAQRYPQDTLTTREGLPITFTFFKHASFSIEYAGKYIYIDPVAAYADYAKQPKADLVLITHSHYDHFDRAAIDTLTDRSSSIVCDKTSAEAFDGACFTMTPGTKAHPRNYVEIEAVPAYNTTEEHLQFHPREREDVGYILTIGGTRIYIAGDTENTPEMKALRTIDVAFLPVNQPYTMTIDQAVDAVKSIRPAIFYPYHYGETDEKTDIDRLVRRVQGITDIRIRPME